MYTRLAQSVERTPFTYVKVSVWSWVRAPHRVREKRGCPYRTLNGKWRDSTPIKNGVSQS